MGHWGVKTERRACFSMSSADGSLSPASSSQMGSKRTRSSVNPYSMYCSQFMPVCANVMPAWLS
eukprot:11103325-Alexandrium_andersonii.AAC.1